MTNDSDETNSNAEYKIYDIFGKEVKKGILKSDRLENVNLQSKGVILTKIIKPLEEEQPSKTVQLINTTTLLILLFSHLM